MIFDAFIYNTEKELLDLRIDILRPFVDRMVLIEGTLTFQGKKRDPQGVALEWHRDLDTFLVELPKRTKTPWEREYAQRNAIKAVLAENYVICSDDVVLISDVDEIPNPERLEEAERSARLGHVVAFQQIHTYFALDLEDPEVWYGTRAISWELLRKTTPQDIRSVNSHVGQELIEDGGWHFGWTGGKEAIREKVRAFCHDDLNDPHLMSDSYLDHCRRTMKTLHNSHALRPLASSRLPKVIQDHPERYGHFFR